MTQGFPPDVTAPFTDPLLTVYGRLVDWFTWEGTLNILTQMGITPPNVVFGYKAREQHLNQGPGQANRVCIIPGSWPDGSDQGELEPPFIRKGIFHRVWAQWTVVFTLSCWAADTTALDDETKQRQAVSSLMNTALTGLRETNGGDFPVAGKVFRDPKVSQNMSFGQELLCQLTVRGEVRGMPTNVSGTPVNVSLTPKT
jgi:hypothetical protein